ncbi:MAG TPA: serine hydrolase domain-containing protein [Alphaproteobacteria bacterium]|nr:serine hydrolase domain-containing protein [Alphaproteobacteria bacterium]
MRNRLGLLCALLLTPAAALSASMQPIKASPSTPVAVAALGTGGGARLAVSDNMPPAELEAFVDGVVRADMDEDHIAGVTVSVVQNGAVVLKKGFGFASYDPVRRVDPDATLFRIGSITKTFTWILIMKAVEEGKIDLDAPVNKYLPADLQIPSQGFKNEIRVRDLMTHSPGFEDRALGILFADTPARIRPLDRWLRETRPNRVREPGELSSYSNYGAALAGEAVSHVEGAPWQDLVEQRIFSPLGLSHISDREPYPARADLPAPMLDALAKDLSQPFRWNAGGFKSRGTEYITPLAPAGVIAASASDMARYMLMLLGDGTLDGKVVFGPVAAKAFRTPMTKLPPESGNWDAGFVDTVMRGGWHAYGHNGGTLSFFSNMILVPELRLGIFVSTNTEGGSKLSDPLPAQIVTHFYVPPPDPPDQGKLKLADALPYIGEYIPTRRPYSGLAGFVQSLQALQVGYSPDGYLTLGFAGQVQRFLPTSDPGIVKSVDGPGEIVFEMKNGRAQRLITPGLAGDRADLAHQRAAFGLVLALALLASIAALVGLFVRLGRGMPKTALQGIATQVQIGSALLFIGAAAGLGVLQAQAADQASLVYAWPVPAILICSWAWLAASVLALVQLGLLVPVWVSSGGWSAWRKLRFSATTFIFIALGLVLALRGALEPWKP